MPLDKLVFILVFVIAAAAATVWIASMVATAFDIGALGWAVFLPVALVVYLVWRVIGDRLSNTKDDHYDRVEK